MFQNQRAAVKGLLRKEAEGKLEEGDYAHKASAAALKSLVPNATHPQSLVKKREKTLLCNYYVTITKLKLIIKRI